MNALKHKRWMVGIDFTPMDESILTYLSFLSKIIPPDKIFFVHVERDFELPDYIPGDLRDSVQKIDVSQKEAIKKQVDKHFEKGNIQFQFDVIEGKPFDTLVKKSKTEEIDLFIAGRKEEQHGSGFLPHNLSRKLSCSILFVPKLKIPKVRRILVPLDFSDHSRVALETAIKVNSNFQGAQIRCLHVYKVPPGYYKSGKSFEDFAEIMKENATKRFKQFISKYKQDIGCDYALQHHISVAELILDEATKIDADLIILGSKGQSAGSLILLGSSTEKLIQINGTIPTWVVKNKDEHIGFFKAMGFI